MLIKCSLIVIGLFLNWGLFMKFFIKTVGFLVSLSFLGVNVLAMNKKIVTITLGGDEQESTYFKNEKVENICFLIPPGAVEKWFKANYKIDLTGKFINAINENELDDSYDSYDKELDYLNGLYKSKEDEAYCYLRNLVVDAFVNPLAKKAGSVIVKLLKNINNYKQSSVESKTVGSVENYLKMLGIEYKKLETKPVFKKKMCKGCSAQNSFESFTQAIQAALESYFNAQYLKMRLLAEDTGMLDLPSLALLAEQKPDESIKITAYPGANQAERFPVPQCSESECKTNWCALGGMAPLSGEILKIAGLVLACFSQSPINYKQCAFDVLGIQKTANQTDIKDAWRKTMLRVHPDRGGSEAMTETANQAYEFLKQIQSNIKKYPSLEEYCKKQNKEDLFKKFGSKQEQDGFVFKIGYKK